MAYWLNIVETLKQHDANIHISNRSLVFIYSNFRSSSIYKNYKESIMLQNTFIIVEHYHY